MDKRGEKHGSLTIICKATKESNGYLHYYWVRCECGYIKRLRYDQIRKGKACGLCDDVIATGVMVGKDGKKEE